LTVLCVVAVLVGLAGWLAWAAGIELELPGDCAANAALAIKLVATSAAVNFVNIVFSLFCGANGVNRAAVRGDVYGLPTECALKWRVG
jgi:hypothetical protein